MKVRVSQPRPDCIIVERQRAWSRFALAALGVLAISVTLGLLDLATGPGLLLLAMAGAALAWLSLAMLRAVRITTWTLVRSQGRLLIDGEPLELARVELRLLQLPITRAPRGYSLSLWLMTSAGPVDIPLGTWRTLLEASSISGTVEDFVQRANIKQPGHTGA